MFKNWHLRPLTFIVDPHHETWKLGAVLNAGGVVLFYGHTSRSFVFRYIDPSARKKALS